MKQIIVFIKKLSDFENLYQLQINSNVSRGIIRLVM